MDVLCRSRSLSRMTKICTFGTAVDALRERLDPGGRMLAVQDFRHVAQREEESVADFL